MSTNDALITGANILVVTILVTMLAYIAIELLLRKPFRKQATDLITQQRREARRLEFHRRQRC